MLTSPVNQVFTGLVRFWVQHRYNIAFGMSRCLSNWKEVFVLQRRQASQRVRWPGRSWGDQISYDQGRL